MTNLTKPADTSDIEDNLETHEGDETNPHSVDESQTGASQSLDNHENKDNPHPGSASDTDLSNHINSTSAHGANGSVVGDNDIPDSTQNASLPGGYDTGSTIVDSNGTTPEDIIVDDTSTADVSNDEFVTVGGFPTPFDEIVVRIDYYQTPADVTLRRGGPDGDVIYDFSEQGGTVSIPVTESRITELTIRNVGGDAARTEYIEVYQVPTASHNHPI